MLADIVLMVGLPASGKSTIVKEYENQGYVIISLDKKTMRSAVDLEPLNDELNKGNKVVIDNTNTTKETRKVFVDYSKRNNLRIRAHYMNTSKDDCLINSLHRMYDRYGEIYLHKTQINPLHKNDTNVFVLSAIFSMAKNFEKIDNNEGFAQIATTKFVRDNRYDYVNKAVFIDLDGTVRKSKGVQPYPIEFEDIEILENSEKILREYKDKGYKIIGVSNQSGVGKKIVTDSRVNELIIATNASLNGVIDDYYYCTHLPPANMCYCRKPQSGMGILMMHGHKLDLSNCIMVGDQTSDKTFATRLGMKFYEPNEFFERS